jgi:hypothetical protein
MCSKTWNYFEVDKNSHTLHPKFVHLKLQPLLIVSLVMIMKVSNLIESPRWLVWVTIVNFVSKIFVYGRHWNTFIELYVGILVVPFTILCTDG